MRSGDGDGGKDDVGGHWMDHWVEGSRFDPDDWNIYTREALLAKYESTYPPEVITEYWEERCKVVAGFKPRGVEEMRIDPRDEEAYTFAEMCEKYNHSERMAVRDYWDMKCSVAFPDNEETEQRLDPDDGRYYTLAELRRRYRGKYSMIQIERYWDWTCKMRGDSELECGDLQQKTDPDDEKTYTLAALRKKYGEHFTPKEVETYWDDTCRQLPVGDGMEVAADIDSGIEIIAGSEKRYDVHDGKGRSLAQMKWYYSADHTEQNIQEYWEECNVTKYDPVDERPYAYHDIRTKYLTSLPEEDIERYWKEKCVSKSDWEITRARSSGPGPFSGGLAPPPPRFGGGASMDPETGHSSSGFGGVGGGGGGSENNKPRFGLKEEIVQIVFEGGAIGDIPYIVLEPNRFADSDESWPLLVWMCGGGEANREPWMNEMIQIVRRNSFLRDHFLILIPIVYQCEAVMSRHKVVNPEALWFVVQCAVERFWDKVDVARIYMTGFSMGADACIRTALLYGGALSAIAPIAGLYDSVWELLTDEGARCIAKLPVRMFHSINDDYVPVHGARRLMHKLGSKLGGGAPAHRYVTVQVQPPGDKEKDHDDKAIKTQGRLTVAGLECVPIDVTFYEGTGKEIWLFPGKGHSYARHPVWHAIYRREEQFGLWKWMLSSENAAARLAYHLSFTVSLRAVRCCNREQCPARRLGLRWGWLPGRPSPVIGTDVWFVDGGRLSRWNEWQIAEGRAELAVRPGDSLVSVNGQELSDGCAQVLDDLGSWPAGDVELGILRACAIEGQRQCPRGDARGNFEAHEEVHRKSCCGDFTWVVEDGKVLNVTDAPWLAAAAKRRQERWFCSRRLLRQTCQEYLERVFEDRLRALEDGEVLGSFLGEALPWHLKPLLWEATALVRQEDLPSALLTLAFAERSIACHYGFLALLMQQVVRRILVRFCTSEWSWGFCPSELCKKANVFKQDVIHPRCTSAVVQVGALCHGSPVPPALGERDPLLEGTSCVVAAAAQDTVVLDPKGAGLCAKRDERVGDGTLDVVVAHRPVVKPDARLNDGDGRLDDAMNEDCVVGGAEHLEDKAAGMTQEKSHAGELGDSAGGAVQEDGEVDQALMDVERAAMDEAGRHAGSEDGLDMVECEQAQRKSDSKHADGKDRQGCDVQEMDGAKELEAHGGQEVLEEARTKVELEATHDGGELGPEQRATVYVTRSGTEGASARRMRMMRRRLQRERVGAEHQEEQVVVQGSIAKDVLRQSRAPLASSAAQPSHDEGADLVEEGHVTAAGTGRILLGGLARRRAQREAALLKDDMPTIGEGKAYAELTAQSEGPPSPSRRGLDPSMLAAPGDEPLPQDTEEMIRRLRQVILHSDPEDLRMNELVPLMFESDVARSRIFWVAVNIWFGRYDPALELASLVPRSLSRRRILTRLRALRDALDHQVYICKTIGLVPGKRRQMMRDRKNNRVRRLDSTYLVPATMEGPDARISFCAWCNTEASLEDCPLILHFHGNAESASEYTENYPRRVSFERLPATTVFVDNRGCGWSSEPFRWSTYCTDAEALIGALPKICENLGLPWPYPGGVVAMGRSLGSIPAIHLAVLYAEQIDALVLDSALACQFPISHLEQNPLFDELSKVLPRLDPPVDGLDRYNCKCCSWDTWANLLVRSFLYYDNVDKISAYGGPLFMLHSEQDSVCPPSQAKALFRAARGWQKVIHWADKRGHNTTQQQKWFWDELGNFLWDVRTNKRRRRREAAAEDTVTG